MRISDWSSDVCSSDLPIVTGFVERADLAVIVINDEPASFIDGYGLLKALAARGRCRRALILTNMTTSEASGRHLFQRFKAVAEKFLERKSTRLNSSH